MSVLDLARPELRSMRPYVPGCLRARLHSLERERVAVADARGHHRARPQRLSAAAPDRAARRSSSEYYGIEQNADPRDARQQRSDRRADPRLLHRGPRQHFGVSADVRHVSALREHPERGSAARAADVASRTSRSIPQDFGRRRRAPRRSSSSARRTIRPVSRWRARTSTRICREVAGRALVVIDEAYHEFADAPALRRAAQSLRARGAAAHAVEVRVARRRAVRSARCRAGARRVRAERCCRRTRFRRRRSSSCCRRCRRMRCAYPRSASRCSSASARGSSAALLDVPQIDEGVSERRELRSRAHARTARRFARRRAAPACSCARSTIRC